MKLRLPVQQRRRITPKLHLNFDSGAAWPPFFLGTNLSQYVEKLILMDLAISKIQGLTVTDDTLSADLSDGRTISVPLAWYPRLLNGSVEERNNWRFIARGEGIHWVDLDDDISITNLILGQPSGESQKSFQRWLKSRANVASL